MRNARQTRLAVTLLELLVTIAATIVLTAVLIVTIRGVRGQTLVMQDLNNLRLSAQDMLVWSAENDSKLLNLESPQSVLWQQTMPVTLNTPERDFWSIYYSQTTDWNRLLGAATNARHMHWQSAYGRPQLPQGMEWAEALYAELEITGDPQLAVKLSRFSYTLTLVTRHELWENMPNALTPGAQIREWAKVVRVSEVRHPAGKGLLVNLSIPDDPLHAHAAFIDGGAKRIPMDGFAAPAIAPERFTPAPGQPVLHTYRGFLGVDRK